ncbi:N-acetylglucosamine kinase [Paenibacillus sp. UNC499MF]|uniref:N-acetylglucosamine kinase n=1 Tax=Paenibacillus sp. UNC499MF TaxID=1502751 RepID=UPI0008A00E11|nr:BadF/BadG/BcrA/BcrD ATPase family protein [Paenibacillus sp. UNC499MF]SEG57396.1 BadF-type ATPase [Paenibacillus sp. UNC499MF]
MDYVIGLDGGGTKTEALAIDLNGAELGTWTGGPGNPHAVTFATASAELGRLLATVREALPGHRCLAVCAGLAGVDTAEERATMEQYLTRTLTGSAYEGVALLIKNDAEIALKAALGSSTGLIAIAGTGSIIYAFDSQGKKYRAGGWGHLLGDQGSGYDIGLSVLQTVMKSYDGVLPPTALTEAVLQKHGIREAPELRGIVYQPGVQKAQIAEHAELAVRAAAAGDTLARQIIVRSAEDLADLVVALRNRHPELHGLQIGAAGSIFAHCPLFYDTFRVNVSQEDDLSDVILSGRRSSAGAAHYAGELAAARTAK